MCGIAGQINLDGAPVSLDRLQRMGEAIAHRGPDGNSEWTDGPVGFAHRRLSIIDLSDRSSQPMHSADGRYTLVFNGEIYNYPELRDTLIQDGQVFKTSGDTEVLLYWLITKGSSGLTQIDGMFGFCLWDRQTKTAFLGRDRFGVKPFYYAFSGKAFVFGSEIKAVLGSGIIEAKLNLEGAVEYLTFMNTLRDDNLFQGVRLLPAGHWAELQIGQDINDGKLVSNSFWDYNFAEPTGAYKSNQSEDELFELFKSAVERQMVADVEVSSYLSGGMDSGSITAVGADLTPNIRSYTCGFDMANVNGETLQFDERDDARAMSEHFGTSHNELIVNADMMAGSLDSIAYHIEEPRVGQSYPNYLVSERVAQDTKVILSGAGGDELFGGYPWRYYQALVNKDTDDFVSKAFAYWQRLIPIAEHKSFFAPVASDVAQFDFREKFKSVFGDRISSTKMKFEDYAHACLYFEAKVFLNGLLMVEDKVAMAHGLEARVPFLDNALVEFACRQPIRSKLGNFDKVLDTGEFVVGEKIREYLRNANDGKMQLRSMMNRLIPKEVTQRRKQGFSGPDEFWFRNEKKNWVDGRLSDKSDRLFDIVDFAQVQRLLSAHQAGENKRLHIWALLNLQSVLKQYGL